MRLKNPSFYRRLRQVRPRKNRPLKRPDLSRRGQNVHSGKIALAEIAHGHRSEVNLHALNLNGDRPPQRRSLGILLRLEPESSHREENVDSSSPVVNQDRWEMLMLIEGREKNIDQGGHHRHHRHPESRL
jgi:hypothetical protein